MTADFPPKARSANRTSDPRARELSLLRAFYLRRLHTIVEKVRHHGGYLIASDRRMVLLNRALLSTYCQCGNLGVAAEARRLLGQLRGEPHAGRAQLPPAIAPL